ncbi:PEP-CTERM sorting domain-containing protein [Verrucomicrobiaceae bacterium 227]
MTSKSLIITGLRFSLLCSVSQAASVNVGGVVETPFRNSEGNILPDGSIIQIGYLLGVDTSTDLSAPENLAKIDWNSFTALTGFGSPKSADNYDTRVSSIFGEGGFFGDALVFDSETDFGVPSELPVRMALRVFDSSTGTANALFNTYTSSADTFILELPNALDTNAGRADIDIGAGGGDSRIIWQGTPFLTDVEAIPEPSTSLSALLGLGLLIGARRRK